MKLCKDKGGYYQFSLWDNGNRTLFGRYQISWLVEYGSLPPKPLQIDHIDGDKTNDHIKNLQALTSRENCSKAHQQNGKTLPAGVSYKKRNKKYVAQIWIDNKKKHLGLFTTVELASASYQKALESL